VASVSTHKGVAVGSLLSRTGALASLVPGVEKTVLDFDVDGNLFGPGDGSCDVLDVLVEPLLVGGTLALFGEFGLLF
jgi:hypothetical protein